MTTPVFYNFGTGPLGSIFTAQRSGPLGPLTYEGGVTSTQSSQPVTPAAVSTSTGVSPLETSYSLYGHTVPVSVLGKGRIGGEIISGPWVSNGLASFIISFGVPADPSGTRILLDIAFDSEIVWQGTLTGAGTPSSSGFITEPFTVRFYDGKLTQSADSLETTHFGSDAVGYVPQILLAFENLPLANTKFKKIPYVSALLSDTSGEDVNLGEAFERIAYSPYINYTSAQFETVGITDGLVGGGLIIAQDVGFLDLIQRFGKFYQTWDILQTDKLRISDRGAIVSPDLILDNSNFIGNVVVSRQGSDSLPQNIELSTIDPDADYTIVPFVAEVPQYPVAITTSEGTDSSYLPAIMDASTRAVMATLARYNQEQTRKIISGKVAIYGLEMEPGALITSPVIGTEVFKVLETLHGADNTVEFSATSILRCDFGTGCDEYTAFIARTSGLNTLHKDAYRALICGLVSDGIWTKLEVLHVYATSDSATALLNLKSSSYNGTLHGSPTFTTDRGFTGVSGSSTVFIDTGFSPMAGGYATDSAHMSLWSVQNVGSLDESPMGNMDAATIFWKSTIFPQASDGKFYGRINSLGTASPAGVTVTNPVGHYLINRSSSTQTNGYKNGTGILSQSVVDASPNNRIYTLAYNVGATAVGASHQLAMASIGASLNASEVSQFYNRLRTYMTTVGVP
jgi:hypothetical protein